MIEHSSIPLAVDQGTATLIAAIVAAVASTVTSLVALVPKYVESRRIGGRRRRLVELLSEDQEVRSLDWLARRLGMSEAEVAAMLLDVNAHGVRMADGSEGAALDSRHRGG